jgi:hypothetical protein
MYLIQKLNEKPLTPFGIKKPFGVFSFCNAVRPKFGKKPRIGILAEKPFA